MFHKKDYVSFVGTDVLFSSEYLFSPLDDGLVLVWYLGLQMSHVKISTLDYEPPAS
jgi:hypothetical protein